MPLHLEIVTPERRAFEGDVDEVVVPGSEGELGILPHHAPLISLLGAGVLRLKTGTETQEFAIFGGFLQVRPDRVVVMAETADLASEIDMERAERAVETTVASAGRLVARYGARPLLFIFSSPRAGAVDAP